MENVIEGNPTKKFFIEMITRDISIEDAIIDLLDNSIDGANRINPETYDNLWIKISIDDKEFIIEDNCGGFSLETAQKYAFRFGRPEEAPRTNNNTVGRFGIGMKRSLFKIGKKFCVESKHLENHFMIDIDVDEWERKKTHVQLEKDVYSEIDDWNFNYHCIEGNDNLSADGTYIRVYELNDEVKDMFSDTRFLSNLSNNIQRLLNFSILKGLKISLNGNILQGNRTDLLMSEVCLPYYIDGQYKDVSYRIVAGLGDVGDPKKSGWYIYCNDRLVLEGDQTTLTGWGLSSIRKWHSDLVMFRGIVYLDSAETISLPLTTTKKGIDATSEVYKMILPLMKESMLYILDFLRDVTKLGAEANSYRETLCEELYKISAVDLKTYQFPESHAMRTFVAPPLDEEKIAQKKNSVRISYEADKRIADNAKIHSETSSYKELGKVTFDYYTRMEDLL